MFTILPKNHCRKCVQQGFTLIELMIVVAIVAILASIAYPSYQESIAKGRRADAQRGLVEATQYMRRIYSAKDSFKDVTLPTALQNVPPTGTALYTLQFVKKTTNADNSTSQSLVDKSVSDSEFVLRMKRNDSGNMATDKCGDLQVDHTGAKSIVNLPTGSTATVATCFPGS